MASETKTTATPCCRLQGRMKAYEEKYPLHTPATSGYGKKLQNMVLQHKRSHQAPDVCAHLKRHDSAARITKPKLTQERVAAILARLSPSERPQVIGALKRHLLTKQRPKMDPDIVRVQLVIEHCTRQTNESGTWPGTMNARTAQIMRIPTRHAPWSGIHAASFAEACGLIRQVYDHIFGACHRTHQHPGTGDIIMELYLRDTSTGRDFLLTESNWRHCVEVVNIMRPPTGQTGGLISAASLVARFTCGYSGVPPKC